MATPEPKTRENDANNSNNNNRKQRLRIACSSQPISGHMNPLMSLAEELSTRNMDENKNEVYFVTLPYGAKKIESRCKALGIRVVGLSEGAVKFDSDEALMGWTKPKVFFPKLAETLKPSFEEALDAIKPDVIVSDFCCLASQEYAASRKIPLVMNWPGPFSTLWDLVRPVVNADSNHVYFAAGGLFVSYVGFSLFRILAWANAGDIGKLANGIQRSVTCGNSTVLVHSFWGLEQPQYLFPPNVVPVGPIEKVFSKHPDFSKSHPELHSVLETWRKKDFRKILLVTTGTLVQLEKWMVKILWEALEMLTRESNVSILWSLKEGPQKFLSKEQLQHPSFFISKWLPQPALLASDLVDGVFTHCGWNGTSECVSGGKPVVVMPFFADQMTNAKLLLKAGCAVAVAPIPAFNVDDTGQSAYYCSAQSTRWFDLGERLRRCFLKSELTVEKVVEACRTILNDPRFARSAKELQALSTGPGKGRKFACDLIEHAGHHGVAHLTDSEHTRNLTGHRPLLVTLAMGGMLGGALAAAASFGILTRIQRR